MIDKRRLTYGLLLAYAAVIGFNAYNRHLLTLLALAVALVGTVTLFIPQEDAQKIDQFFDNLGDKW